MLSRTTQRGNAFKRFKEAIIVQDKAQLQKNKQKQKRKHTRRSECTLLEDNRTVHKTVIWSYKTIRSLGKMLSYLNHNNLLNLALILHRCWLGNFKGIGITEEVFSISPIAHVQSCKTARARCGRESEPHSSFGHFGPLTHTDRWSGSLSGHCLLILRMYRGFFWFICFLFVC